MEGKRPKKEKTLKRITRFLRHTLGEIPDFSLAEDGDDGWAFWVLASDTTSYVHHDLRLEWYGTGWRA